MFDYHKKFKSLLPSNSTDFEKAFEKALYRDEVLVSKIKTSIYNEDTGVKKEKVTFLDLWNPETCHSSYLPFLAWAFRVEAYDESWDEDKKREYIALYPKLRIKAGTKWAKLEAFKQLGINADIFRDKRPYSFKVRTYNEITEKQRDAIFRLTNALKSGRDSFVAEKGKRLKSVLGVGHLARLTKIVKLKIGYDMDQFSIITTAGRSKVIAANRNGLDVQFNKIVISEKPIEIDPDTGRLPKLLIEIPDIVDTFPITDSDDIEDGRLHITVMIDGQKEYNIATMGIMGVDADGNEFLFSYMSDPNNISIKKRNEEYILSFDQFLEELPRETINVVGTGERLDVSLDKEFLQVQTNYLKILDEQAKIIDRLTEIESKLGL